MIVTEKTFFEEFLSIPLKARFNMMNLQSSYIQICIMYINKRNIYAIITNEFYCLIAIVIYK